MLNISSRHLRFRCNRTISARFFATRRRTRVPRTGASSITSAGRHAPRRRRLCCAPAGHVSARRQVSVATHRGFDGGLDVRSTGAQSVYFATATTELMFHVATLMPTRADDPQVSARGCAVVCCCVLLSAAVCCCVRVR